MQSDYTPSDEDILYLGMREGVATEDTHIIPKAHVGISKLKDDCLVKIIDSGTQRCQSKKWIYCFERLQLIIFVVALNGYATVTFEDPTYNTMHQTLKLFEDMISRRWLRVKL